MKQLLFDDIYSWSIFSEARQMDFNGHLWVRPEGNILIDPVPMIDSDLAQLRKLGGANYIVITNRDHQREAFAFKRETGGAVVIHEADASQMTQAPDRQITDGESIVPGLIAVSLRYGKTPGEIALHFSEKGLLLFGDHVIGRPLGALRLLENEKLENPFLAAMELKNILALSFDGILVGDGHSIVVNARPRLIECLDRCNG